MALKHLGRNNLIISVEFRVKHTTTDTSNWTLGACQILLKRIFSVLGGGGFLGPNLFCNKSKILNLKSAGSTIWRASPNIEGRHSMLYFNIQSTEIAKRCASLSWANVYWLLWFQSTNKQNWNLIWSLESQKNRFHKLWVITNSTWVGCKTDWQFALNIKRSTSVNKLEISCGPPLKSFWKVSNTNLIFSWED